MAGISNGYPFQPDPVFYVPPIRVVAPPGVTPSFDPINFFKRIRSDFTMPAPDSNVTMTENFDAFSSRINEREAATEASSARQFTGVFVGGQKEPIELNEPYAALQNENTERLHQSSQVGDHQADTMQHAKEEYDNDQTDQHQAEEEPASEVDNDRLFDIVFDDKGNLARVCKVGPYCPKVGHLFHRRDAMERHLKQVHGLENVVVPSGGRRKPDERPVHGTSSSYEAERARSRFYDVERKWGRNRRKFESNMYERAIRLWYELPEDSKVLEREEWIKNFVNVQLEKYDRDKPVHIAAIKRKIERGYENYRRKRGMRGSIHTSDHVDATVDKTNDKPFHKSSDSMNNTPIIRVRTTLDRLDDMAVQESSQSMPSSTPDQIETKLDRMAFQQSAESTCNTTPDRVNTNVNRMDQVQCSESKLNINATDHNDITVDRMTKMPCQKSPQSNHNLCPGMQKQQQETAQFPAPVEFFSPFCDQDPSPKRHNQISAGRVMQTEHMGLASIKPIMYQFTCQRLRLDLMVTDDFLERLSNPDEGASILTMNFFSEWLEYNCNPTVSSKIWVVDPVWVELISNFALKEQLRSLLGLVDSTCDIVFFPFAHNGHWTLFTVFTNEGHGLSQLCNKPGIIFMNSLNSPPSAEMCEAMKAAIQIIWDKDSAYMSLLKNSQLQYPIPQQLKSFDCGFYVMFCMHLICEMCLKGLQSKCPFTESWFDHDDINMFKRSLSKWGNRLAHRL